MRFPLAFLLPAFVCLSALPPAGAQTPVQNYTGYRIALFDFEVLQVRGKTVMMKCRIANTGRLEAGLKKNSRQTLVELDTLNVPNILWGHEEALVIAALNQLPRLQAGETSEPVWLNVSAGERTPDENTPGACADLVFDTAYIGRYTDDEILLRYELRNAGTAPAEIAGKTIQVDINVYYVSGLKLTRGAIPAGNSSLGLGRETLDGWLNPGQKTAGEIVISLKKRTKFARNLLLELAPPPTLNECDRTNNTRCIEVID